MNTMKKQKAVFAKVRISDMNFLLLESLAVACQMPVEELIQNGLRALLDAGFKEISDALRKKAGYGGFQEN